jgi:hypothetical protein
MLSQKSEVIVLCWNTPSRSDSSASKIAALLGAEVTFISLNAENLVGDASIGELVPRCTCLIVDAQTLAAAADAMRTGISGLQSVLNLADRVFIYGFQSTDRHNNILRSLSSGVLLGVEITAETNPEFHVTEGHRELSGQFSGLSIGVPGSTNESSFVEVAEKQQRAVIIRYGKKPFFVRTDVVHSQLFLVACKELADLDEKVGREACLLSWFSRLVPLMMFLRGGLGNRVWHNDRPRACFIIDDPLLKTRHGFLEYRRFVEIMCQQKFAACIAFIPWNHRRSSKEVAELFSSNHGMLSLCVHGCDHSRGEFATTRFDSLCAKARLALQRMQAHRQVFGIPFDGIMIFPQGLFSSEAMAALDASGYLAAVNTSLCPSTMPGTLVLRDLLEVALTKFADFPLFGRRYPQNLAEFAFDLFMGKPALAVEHHRYFRSGYKELAMFVTGLKALDERIEWAGLGRLCSRACLTKTAENGDVYVRFYTRRFWLRNDGTQTHRYILLRQRTPSDRLPSVAVDGHDWDCEQENGNLKICLSLDPGQTADIQVLPDDSESFGSSRRQTEVPNARVWIRRHLCEFRDNYVDCFLRK